MTMQRNFLMWLLCSALLAGCGGGDGTANPPVEDPLEQAVVDDVTIEPGSDPGSELQPVIPVTPDENATVTDRARYRVTLENLWGAEEFPQGFPIDAHLSLIGGATHNVAVSFWEMGEVASRGIEDMAETGRIDILLFDDVAAAIDNGTADSMIEIRDYTGPKINGVPGTQSFDLELNIDWPLVSLVTMLGPSPDWFVGVSGLSLLENDEWQTKLSVNLPLFDGGSKSDVTPTMGGPDIIPPNPIALVAYDTATGVYLPSSEPQHIARLTFDRIDL